MTNNIQSYPKVETKIYLERYGLANIPAYQVSEQFLVHRTVENDYSDRSVANGWKLSDKFWTITHAATGLSLFNYIHLGKNAVEVVNEIESRWGKIQLLENQQIDRDKHEGFTEYYFDVKAKINFGY